MTRTKQDERKSNSSKCSEDFSFLFSHRLSKAREHAELTQECVADKLNVTVRTYQKWELHESVPNIEIIAKISKMFDCDISYLTGENAEDEYRKEIAQASETTGLKYESIELLNKAKNISSPDSKESDYLSRKLLFILNFMIQNIKCRNLLDYLYHYWFKHYSFSVNDNGGGSNTITFEDESGIEDRNVGFYVSDISDSILYSFVTQLITKIGITETQNIDTSECEYTPTKQEIENDIQFIDEEIAQQEIREYSTFLPYTPKYALQCAFRDGLNLGRLDLSPDEELKEITQYGDTLANEIMRRVNVDALRDKNIEQLNRRKKELQYKHDKLYPKKKLK